MTQKEYLFRGQVFKQIKTNNFKQQWDNPNKHSEFLHSAIVITYLIGINLKPKKTFISSKREQTLLEKHCLTFNERLILKQ